MLLCHGTAFFCYIREGNIRRILSGHRKVDPNFPENNQPTIVGYARNYRAEVVDSGHIGLFTSRDAARVAQRVADFVRAPSGAAAVQV